MAYQDWVVWAALLALLSGVVASLGLLRSAQRALGIAVVLACAQVVGWMIFVTVLSVQRQEGGVDWNPYLHASFLVSLMVIIPFITIGAVVAGVVVGAVRRRAHGSRSGAGTGLRRRAMARR
jgi:hypothetical protein